ncbi:unnamed protein product [Timema podura]|uniref:Uncharacterized protein n=1 Tax=Timema podura TaxID=61482 RepID=A0ABN7PT02_TIMPD|nr:unnamed protein product [Timema podura]
MLEHKGREEGHKGDEGGGKSTGRRMVNHGLLALCTPREVQEMDISLLLELPSWLEDECEIDLINLYK